MSFTFYLVYTGLEWLSRITGLTYEMINVIVWYGLLPLIYVVLLDRIFKTWVLSAGFILVVSMVVATRPNFSLFADHLFDLSVDFLHGFAVMGLNYDRASVLVCVLLPFVVFLVLLSMAFPNGFRRHLPSISKILPWLKQ